MIDERHARPPDPQVKRASASGGDLSTRFAARALADALGLPPRLLAQTGPARRLCRAEQSRPPDVDPVL